MPAIDLVPESLREAFRPFYFKLRRPYDTYRAGRFLKVAEAAAAARPDRFVLHDHADADRIWNELTQLQGPGCQLKTMPVDRDGYQEYLDQVDYSRHYREGNVNFTEKSLEHYTSLILLGDLEADMVDIAGARSPFHTFIPKLKGRSAFIQDPIYPAGRHGRHIGGWAHELPLEDASVGGMTLHCSLEHFEGDSDIQLIEMAAAKLMPGARLVVIPLYLSTIYLTATDPMRFDVNQIPFDPASRIFLNPGWTERHGRQYSVEKLSERLLSRAAADFDVTIYRITNAKDFDPGCYLQFALVLERRR